MAYYFVCVLDLKREWVYERTMWTKRSDCGHVAKEAARIRKTIEKTEPIQQDEVEMKEEGEEKNMLKVKMCTHMSEWARSQFCTVIQNEMKWPKQTIHPQLAKYTPIDLRP